MENTLENKKKFFALHFGQYILNSGDPEQNPDCEPYTVGHFDLKHMDLQKYLQLKPISAISDDGNTKHLLVATIKSWDKEYEDLDSDDLEEWLEDVLTGNCAIHSDYVSGYQMIELVDFLRTKGFLLPYHDLTTEQLIEYGWAKIKANEQ